MRARGADPKASYGDLIAISAPVDEQTASLIAGVVSDGIVAPDYAPGALEILARKRGGAEWSAHLRGVTLVSDGLFPFRDSIDQATRHGVAYVAQPGGAVRDPEIEAACREHGMTMVHTGLRLFHH